MKLILLILTLGGLFPVAAQDFLGKSSQEARQTFIKMEGKIQVKQDTLYAETQEEDERGRIFEVSYTLVFEAGNCVAYRQKMDLHEYWVARILELVELKEGKENGDPIEINGEQLYSAYEFADFKMNLSVQQGSCWLDFRLSRE